MVCCGFGNREIYKDINSELKKSIINAINLGCTTFYTGGMGEFDRLFSQIIIKLKSQNQNLSLICVRPYLTKELNDNKEYYYSIYDDIIIPTELCDVHYKSIITKRNEWIIDHSDIVIAHTIRDFGGAYNAIRYAESKNKLIFNI